MINTTNKLIVVPEHPAIIFLFSSVLAFAFLCLLWAALDLFNYPKSFSPLIPQKL